MDVFLPEYPKTLDFEEYTVKIDRLNDMDRTDESYTATYSVTPKGFRYQTWDNETMDRFLEEFFPGEHCQHSYDCCANWYPSRGNVSLRRPDWFLVSQRVHLNI